MTLRRIFLISTIVGVCLGLVQLSFYDRSGRSSSGESESAQARSIPRPSTTTVVAERSQRPAGAYSSSSSFDMPAPGLILAPASILASPRYADLEGFFRSDPRDAEWAASIEAQILAGSQQPDLRFNGIEIHCRTRICRFEAVVALDSWTEDGHHSSSSILRDVIRPVLDKDTRLEVTAGRDMVNEQSGVVTIIHYLTSQSDMLSQTGLGEFIEANRERYEDRDSKPRRILDLSDPDNLRIVESTSPSVTVGDLGGQ